MRINRYPSYVCLRWTWVVDWSLPVTMCSVPVVYFQLRSLRIARNWSESPNSSTSWASSWPSAFRTTGWSTYQYHSPSLSCSAWGTSSLTWASCYTSLEAHRRVTTLSGPTCSPSCYCLRYSLKHRLRKARRLTQWAALMRIPNPSSSWTHQNQNLQLGTTVSWPGTTSSLSTHTGLETVFNV